MAQQVQAYFANTEKVDVRIRKILGAGGAGVALLCDAASPDPGIRAKNFVLKVDQHSKAGTPGITMEKECHMVCVLPEDYSISR